jgi:hypothetical protein
MLFFIDESGQDHKELPYEILAGIGVREQDLWNIIQWIQREEINIFGIHLSNVGVEMKGTKLLKKKIFRFASQEPPITNLDLRRTLCYSFLTKGFREQQGGEIEPRSKGEFTAYGQAVLDFVQKIFDICGQYRVKTFASIVNIDSERVGKDFLRKDYSYLFERFFYYLEDFSPNEMGIIVFDELEKAQCRILIDQMEKYFTSTGRGNLRSARIIPEPFFVHSDLTTAIQIVDLMAYCINWGIRLRKMNKPTRQELIPFGQSVFDLRYVGERQNLATGKNQPIYGITYIDDLRPRQLK